jgi:hypothetical protein
VLRLERGLYDLVYLHRIGTAWLYLPMARHYMPQARIVFAVADLHHLRLARQAEVEQQPEMLVAARRVQAREWHAVRSADRTLTHSAVEAAMLRNAVPETQVHVVPWAVAVRPTAPGFGARAGIAFVGHYAHLPNLNGALWLIDEIMPLVRAVDRSIECVLIGSAMPEILTVPREGVVAVGAVPDLAAALAGVRLTVAALSFGAGIKGKVVDSLAMGVPCVCSTIAAEGLDLPRPLQDLVARDTAGLVRSILRLYGDETLWTLSRQAGLDWAAEGFSEARVDAMLSRAIGLQQQGSGVGRSRHRISRRAPGALDTALITIVG